MNDTYREKEQRGIRVTRFEDEHGEGRMEAHPNGWRWKYYECPFRYSSGYHPTMIARLTVGRDVTLPPTRKPWWRRLMERLG